jgi:hypothetical protein
MSHLHQSPGTFHQRTEITKAQLDIFVQLQIDPPRGSTSSPRQPLTSTNTTA